MSPKWQFSGLKTEVGYSRKLFFRCNEAWRIVMNDDWDGVDWAEHFSGPDDNEIEQIQEDAYQSSLPEEDEEASFDKDFAYDSGYTVYEDAISNAAAQQHIKSADIAYDFGFDNIKELNIFIAYIRRLHAKEIKITRYGPLPEPYDLDEYRINNFKRYQITFKAQPIDDYSIFFEGFKVFNTLDFLAKFGYLDI